MGKKFGLVGRNISYSYSKKYFSEKFEKLGLDYSYEIYDLQSIEEVIKILDDDLICGFNVTVPYKQLIIPFLDDISPEAEEIGAINTVVKVDGKSKGYNTDVYGFAASLDFLRDRPQNSALILGDGGAAKAVKYVLKERKITYQTISRKGLLNFDQITDALVSAADLIIQCTPVGTFPNIEDCVKFPFHALNEKHTVIDLIYNPEETAFLRKASEQKAMVMNGLLMLEKQAEKAWEIWNKHC